MSFVPPAATRTAPLYSAGVQDLPPNSVGTEKSLLWWMHPYYRAKWKPWHASWRKLKDRIPANQNASPADVIARLKEAHCDPDVAVRLAFLEACHKPATPSELAKDNKRQQKLKRKLGQARDDLWKAMLALSKLTGSKKVRVDRKTDQYRSHVAEAAAELEKALSEMQLIFVTPADIQLLRKTSKSISAENLDVLKRLVDMCNHALEVLLWSRAVEPDPGHELYSLVSYVKACSGAPDFPLVTDLLDAVYKAHERWPQTRGAIEKQAERFSKVHSFQAEGIERSTLERVKSGALRQELLACYPE
jgi:hypothetical protein